MTILRADFEYICAFAREKTAISIDNDREHFVESRVGPVAESEGYESIQQLCQVMRGQRELTNLHLKVIDAITTNETLFFRDIHPFDALRQEIIPALLAADPRRKLQIWSAACSTGQEPYSIAILLKESFPSLVAAGNVSIHATDLVPRVLDRARLASYSEHEMKRGMPPALLDRYFTLGQNRWTLRDDVRSMVRFEQMNLIGAWPALPAYDIICLRNVLIYFDVDVKRRVLSNIARSLHPGGYLFMGSAETPIGLSPLFQAQNIGKSVVYRLVE